MPQAPVDTIGMIESIVAETYDGARAPIALPTSSVPGPGNETCHSL